MPKTIRISTRDPNGCEKSADLAKTAAARAAAKATLGGKSPRGYGEEKAKKALEWIYRFGWSSPSVIESLSNTKRAGLTTKLVKNLLVKKTKTEAGGGVKDVPVFILTLTNFGIEIYEKDIKTRLDYETDPHRIRQELLRHDHLIQISTLNALKKGSIKGYLTQRELIEISLKDVKQPDVVWILNNDMKCAVEIELSAKWARELDEFVKRTVLSLLPSEENPPRFDFVSIVTDSQAIIDRYKEAFKTGNEIDLWTRNDTRHWIKDGFFKVPKQIEGKIKWQLTKVTTQAKM